MGAGINLPQVPPVAIGGLGLIGLGVGPGAAGYGGIGSIANNIVLLRGIPAALQPLVPTLLTNPWTAVALGLAIASTGGPIQSLGSYLGELSAQMEAQAWGYLGRPRSVDVGFKPPRAFEGQTLRGTYSKTGRTLIQCVYTLNYGGPAQVYNFSWTKSNVKGAYFWGQYGTSAAPYYSRLSFITTSGGEFDDEGIYGGGYSNPADPWTASGAFTFTALDGEATPIEGPWGTGSNLVALPNAVTSLGKVGTETPQPSAPAPLPAYLPGAEPAAVPNAVPVTVPQTDPNAEPGTPGRPVIAPPIAPPISPSRTPVSPTTAPTVARPLGPNGQQLPIPLPKPTPTPADNHYVNGEPITTGQPRTDLESIAKEVGRIESKTALSLQQMAGPAGALDKLLDLLDLLERIAALLDATTPAGEYAISSPCVLDENGDRIETTIPYSGGPILGRVESKVDSLAALLQAHKDLKQPICDPGGIPRSNVTVTFTEV